ncbi:MAG TPA: L-arabinose isomerase [Vicinamibacterales bacterium]|nr:L-arabinose isomerase [Vicinamibacterales bacterium]
MIVSKPDFDLWFITGSQHLYGPETLERVARDSRAIVDSLNGGGAVPYPVTWQPTVKTAEEVSSVLEAATADARCAGVITWMHTFSPAKMWIRGLSALRKPLLQFHTQFNRDIPWASIDMDFMNLNQSAHGDREHAHITARLGLPRAIVAGHWQDAGTVRRVGVWARAAAAVSEGRRARFVRFGDNMREVAVTDGDKVAAQIRFGWSVNSFGVGELAQRVARVNTSDVGALIDTYRQLYTLDAALLTDATQLDRLRVQARLEIAIRAFLEEGNYRGFTTNFEDLYGLDQLPGLAAQRLMADGYGFAGEGDWKTAALVRAMKLMADGLPGGTSFMEDYTYHLEGGRSMVLGSHMLEICPSIAKGRPRVEIHPLGIGGKDDPARLVFNAAAGDAINASLVEFGDRFRLVVNEVNTIDAPHAMPKLPVAQAVWVPYPDFTTGLEGWLWAGGAHHTGYSTQIDSEHLQIYADLLGIEFVRIGKGTSLEQVRAQLTLQDLLARRY